MEVFLYALYSAWMKREVSSERPVSHKEFTKHFANYVEATPSCGWIVPRGGNGKKLCEPATAPSGTSLWLCSTPCPTGSTYNLSAAPSVRSVSPPNIPMSARRLLRAPVTLSDDETDKDEQPAPTQPRVTTADDPVTLAATAVSEESVSA